MKKNNFKSKRFILKYIKSIPDKNLTSFFKMVYDGQSYAGNNKTGKAKRNTRVSIIIPKDIANNNLKFMYNWSFLIIGIKEGDN